MLSTIVESKRESAVLNFFLIAPKRTFSLQELSRRLGIAKGKLAGILRTFAKNGILKTFLYAGRKFYYFSSRDAQVLGLQRALARRGKSYGDELFVAVRGLGQIRAAFLSGIFTAQPHLPVDVLLVGRINLKALAGFLKQCRKFIGREPNYSIMTVGEFQLRRGTFDKFIKDIFDYPHLVVVDKLGSKKVKHH